MITPAEEMAALQELLYERTTALDRLQEGKHLIQGFLQWLINQDESFSSASKTEIRRRASVALTESGWGSLCHYCHVVAKTTDHIVPLSLGGMDSGFNRVPSCLLCNKRKGSKVPSCGCDTCTAAVLFHLYREERCGFSLFTTAWRDQFEDSGRGNARIGHPA